MFFMIEKMHIIRLDACNETHLTAIVELHTRLLPNSLYAQLGNYFLKDFYYKKLSQAAWMKTDFYECEGKWVGFISYTEFPEKFSFVSIFRHYFFHLWYALLRAVVQKPNRVFILWRAFRENVQRNKFNQDELMGEILSFAVFSSYITHVNPETGKKISDLLFEHAFAYLKRMNLKKARLLVKKSNKLALRFYASHGGAIAADYDDLTYLVHFLL